MTKKALFNEVLIPYEAKKADVGQKPKESAETNVGLIFHPTTPNPVQNISTIKNNGPYYNSQRGRVTNCQSSTGQFLKVTLTISDGTERHVLSSKVAFTDFQKKANFRLLASVGKDIELTDLNPAKEANTYWITPKTTIVAHTDDASQGDVIRARHNNKDEDK